MSLSISNTGLELIKKFEGCRLKAYQDSVGVWTIGYGHTSGVKSGQVITQAQADAYLKADCAAAEKAVNTYNSTYEWNQNQFDALVSFTFNCGSGNLKTLLQNGTRTIAQISTMITAYNKAGGAVLQGLVNRRAAEKQLFDKVTTNTTNNTTTATTVTTKENLTIDGIWGTKTTTRAQQVFNTPVDGIVSKQLKAYKDSNPGLGSCFNWDGTSSDSGSQLIRAIQTKVGAKEDGHIGPDTITKMQAWLGTTQDGKVSNPSLMVKAFQKWLNEQ